MSRPSLLAGGRREDEDLDEDLDQDLDEGEDEREVEDDDDEDEAPKRAGAESVISMANVLEFLRGYVKAKGKGPASFGVIAAGLGHEPTKNAQKRVSMVMSRLRQAGAIKNKPRDLESLTIRELVAKKLLEEQRPRGGASAPRRPSPATSSKPKPRPAAKGNGRASTNGQAPAPAAVVAGLRAIEAKLESQLAAVRTTLSFVAGGGEA